MYMRIRMVLQMSGTRDGVEWPAPGGEIELPASEALMLIKQRMAVAVEALEEPKQEEKPETKAEAPKAPAKRGPGRPRKTTVTHKGGA